MMMKARNMKSSVIALVVAAASAGLIGCNGNSEPAKLPGGGTVKDGRGNTVSAAAANAFNDGLKAMAQHDEANDWNDGNCKSTAESFLKAADEQGKEFHEASYNAGVAYQRCKNEAEAKKIFESILGKKADFHRARVHLALYEYAADGDIAKAISEMNRAIEDAKFKNEEALVNLAMLQMKRDSSEAGSGCEDDFSCAKLNLQRALAINDGFMPAFNQLAVYYLELAKRRAAEKAGKSTRKKTAVAAGAEAARADQQSLELAALVVSQALRKNPNYAPVHNTSGLVSAELGDLSSAARAFGTARKLDPKFFEAHMNYAAVNLQFRGFAQAEDAYRQALKLKPNDFEAHLGLALAVRGQITDSNWDKNVKETETLLAKAKQISPDRPETYYNEAILTQEFKAKGGKNAEGALKEAKNLFGQFVNKAEGKDEFTGAVTRAKERMEEIDQIIEFNRQSAEEQKRMEAEQRAREAKEQLEKNKAK